MSDLPRCTNDGSDCAPRLVPFLNLGGLEDLPESSSGYALAQADLPDQLKQIRDAGFEGVQHWCEPHVVEAVQQSDLLFTVTGGVRENGDADQQVGEAKACGAECITVHAGWGLESDDRMDELVDEILAAEEAHGIGCYVETHRSTMTQDNFRTAQLSRRRPRLGFNGDFSHWYTGLEMPYAGVNRVMAATENVFDRVRHFHGRIGNSGCIQVDIGPDLETALGRPNVQDFVTMWTRAFRGFKQAAGPGDWLAFAPELLKPEINYARTFSGPDGKPREEGDRWQQALLYLELANHCWDQA